MSAHATAEPFIADEPVDVAERDGIAEKALFDVQSSWSASETVNLVIHFPVPLVQVVGTPCALLRNDGCLHFMERITLLLLRVGLLHSGLPSGLIVPVFVSKPLVECLRPCTLAGREALACR